jgi:aryl-alcohol dehydrogenase-like predicted oxidoreductase
MCACMELVYHIAFAFVSSVAVAYISSQCHYSHLNVATFPKDLTSKHKEPIIPVTYPTATMPNQKPVKVVFGAGFIGDALVGDDVKTVVDLFRKHGHVEIDTAAGYPINDAGGSEKALGQQDLDWARVSTKLSAMKERANSLENLREGLKDSLERLNRKEVDIYYFHLPEAATPMEEQAAAMDEAYRAGKFKRFGISNFTPQDVEELMEVVERKGECSPSFVWRYS